MGAEDGGGSSRIVGSAVGSVAAVGAAAERIAGAFADDGETLIAAAFLHDIGYGPELAVTSFHPLDGGRFVRNHWLRLAAAGSFRGGWPRLLRVRREP